jgi:hypothetical protein
MNIFKEALVFIETAILITLPPTPPLKRHKKRKGDE